MMMYITGAFACGVWLASWHDWSLLFLYGLAGLTFFAVLWQVRFSPHSAAGAIAGLVLLAGMISWLQTMRISADDITNFIGQEVSVSGVVDALPRVTELPDGGVHIKYILQARTVEVGSHERVNASGCLQVNVNCPANSGNKDYKVAAFGDNLQAEGLLKEIHGYQNPGQLDIKAALHRQGISAAMSTQQRAIVISQANVQINSWQARLALWRQHVRQEMEQVMPASDAAMLNGILFGGYSGIKKATIRDFAATGIIHILSVSGTHIALVAGVILWLGGRLGTRWQKLIRLLAVAAIVLYGAVSGFTPPVVRSVVMGSMTLAALGLGREQYVPAALAASALGMLVYQPDVLYDISFQLSFGATAGLVFFYQQTAGWLQAKGHMPIWLAAPLAVTVAAQLGVVPIIAWYYNNFSLVSFLANILVVPLVEIVVIGGLSAALLSLLSTAVAALVYVQCSLLLGLISQMTAWLALLPGGVIYLPALTLGKALLYYLLLFWLYDYRFKFVPAFSVCLRRWPSISATIVFLLLLGGAFSLWDSKAVAVHFLDVGQGDAVLLTTPHGKAMLIDSGGTMNSNSAESFDVGERVVVPYLRHYGVRELECIILTHGHQDHAGGAAAVAAAMPVKRVIFAQEKFALPLLALERQAKNSLFIPAYTGQQLEVDGVYLTVLQALQSMHNAESAAKEDKNNDAISGLSLAKGKNGSGSNEVSSVLKVSYGQHSFLLTGDLGASGEKQLLASGQGQPVTVLKVGHHGSRTSSTPDFIKAFAPQYAIISVGYGNRFGHPHLETLLRLRQYGTAIYRTDQQGAIVFRTDGRQMIIETFVSAEGKKL